MTEQQTRSFAQAIDKEASIVADTFDGTIGDGAFRNRVATLYYATGIFSALNGISVKDCLDRIAAESMRPKRNDG